jgi:hypothetical protein
VASKVESWTVRAVSYVRDSLSQQRTSSLAVNVIMSQTKVCRNKRRVSVSQGAAIALVFGIFLCKVESCDIYSHGDSEIRCPPKRGRNVASHVMLRRRCQFAKESLLKSCNLRAREMRYTLHHIL